MNSPPKSKSKRRRIYLLIGIVCLVVAFVGASKATMDYTSRPAFCGSCHLMHTRYVSWERSLHNKGTCFQCHSKPGLVGEAQAKLNGLKYLYYGIMGYRDVSILRAEVSSLACMRCHDVEEMDRKVLARVNPVQHITRAHKSHVLDLNISCTDCHGDIMHINLEGQSKKAWGSCKSCHMQSEFLHWTSSLVPLRPTQLR